MYSESSSYKKGLIITGISFICYVVTHFFIVFGCPVLAGCPDVLYLGWLVQAYIRGSPVQADHSLLSYVSYSVLALLSGLFCPDCPDPMVLSWLFCQPLFPCPDYSVLAVQSLFKPTCPLCPGRGWPVQTELFRMSSPGCPLHASCSVFPLPAFLSWLSYQGCPA